MNKKEWRERGIQLLSNYSKVEKKETERQLHHRLFTSFLWKQSYLIGVTLSSPIEWDTRKIIERAWQEGKEVVVPKTTPATKELKFYRITDFNQVTSGHFGIEEPVVELTELVEKEEIDLLIVPGLMYHPKGYRIGFGGGYYDRFLVDFQQPTLSILHSDQISSKIPIEEHDIAINYFLTQENLSQTQH